MAQLAQAQPDPFEAAGFTDQGAAPTAVGNPTVGVGNPTVDPFESAGFVDNGPGAMRATTPRGFVENVLTPFTSYPSTYNQMQRESREQMGEGIGQAGQAIQDMQAPQHSLHMPVPVDDPAGFNLMKGVGKAALGGLGYVFSPVNAALETVVGKPVENVTGIPSAYTDFAAGLALPIPKRLPTLNVASKAERADHVENLFSAADDAYEAARASPKVWTPQEIAGFKGDVADTMKEAGHRDYTAPKTFRALDELNTTDPANAGDVIAVRKTLSKIARKSPDESDAAVTAMKKVDDLLSVIPEAETARGTYAAAKRAETVHDALSNAELNAATSGSGQNIDNTTRQAFKSIVQNPKARRGFSQEELEQMARISRGSWVGNISRYAGNMLGGGGGAGGAVSAGAGFMTLGPKGLALPAFGYAFKKLGNVLTARQTGVLEDMLRQRTPNALPKITNPLSDWQTAAQAFEVSPVPRNLARVSIASRNLSNNLSDVGINLSPENLIRSVLPSTAANEGTP